jgi:hypothetical protein
VPPLQRHHCAQPLLDGVEPTRRLGAYGDMEFLSQVGSVPIGLTGELTE